MLASPQRLKKTVRVYSSSGPERPAKPFSWREELKQVFKFLNILWWPLFRNRQRYFTHSRFLKDCKDLPGFRNLWDTIQKGSFAYNSLFLGIRPWQRSSSSTDLADLTTLALFFGDEFIDGVCKAAGKNRMRALLNSDPGRFYLQKKIRSQQVQLIYFFNLNKLLPDAVMAEITPKYLISYKKFYDLLDYFLKQMNGYLSKMPFEKANKAADKIMDVCNTCLESYLHDVNSDPVGESIEEVKTVLHFHEAKTRYMQEKLLELRCILANKEHKMNSSQTEGWLDIMRVVQICDDLQDVLEDEGFQDNLVISVAFHHFPEEWKWLQKNKQLLQEPVQNHFLLSIFLPQTIHYCFDLATARIRTMNWEQQKIIHYLLFNNWFLAGSEKEITKYWGTSVADKKYLLTIFKKLKAMMPDRSEQLIKAYVIDTCFHLKSGRIMLRKKLDWKSYYQLRFNLLYVPVFDKSVIFDRMVQNSKQ
jgi:hypothetical protein